MTADMLFGRSLEGFADAVREWEGFERYVPYLEAFKKSFLGKVLKTYKANRSEFGFNVLNHADFHLRNLLFKKNVEGTIEDFYFVSFEFNYQDTFSNQLHFRSTIKSATMQALRSI